jgi:hypothetical protein
MRSVSCLGGTGQFGLPIALRRGHGRVRRIRCEGATVRGRTTSRALAELRGGDDPRAPMRRGHRPGRRRRPPRTTEQPSTLQREVA